MKREIKAVVYQTVKNTKIEVAYSEGANSVILPSNPVHEEIYSVMECKQLDWNDKTRIIDALLNPPYGQTITARIMARDFKGNCYSNIADCPLHRATTRALNRYKVKPHILVGGSTLGIKTKKGGPEWVYMIPVEYWNPDIYNDINDRVKEQNDIPESLTLCTLELKLKYVW